MEQKHDFSILDHILEGCHIIDFDFRYVYVNEVAAKHWRKTREELLGRTLMEVYPGIESTAVFSVLKKCLAESTFAEIENEFHYPNGKITWFSLRISPMPEGILILSIDITKHKQTTLELQSQLRRMMALREIDLAILGTIDLPVALKTILEKVCSELNVDAGDILLLNRYTNMLEILAKRGFHSVEQEHLRFRLGQGYAGRAALEQEMVFVPDLLKADPPFLRQALLAAEGFISFCATPLIAKGKLVGVLEVFHRTPLQSNQSWFNFLKAVAGQASIAIENGRLFQKLQRANLDLTLAYDATLEGWTKALELRDRETEGHTQRVTEMTVMLATMAKIPENELIHIRRGALLHDIGKLGVPDSVLLKPDKLNDDEWIIMRKHPVFAYEWLKPIEYLRPCLAIPYSHHEKWDGTGYPQGSKGEQIPLAARIFAVVDVWDALTSDRPYRRAWSQKKTLEYIQQQVGTHFDPKVIEFFLQMIHETKNGKTD